jgi:hypothetical protein
MYSETMKEETKDPRLIEKARFDKQIGFGMKMCSFSAFRFGENMTPRYRSNFQVMDIRMD